LNTINVVLLIFGALFLIGGIGTILLISANNGLTQTLTEFGYQLLAICAGGALIGFVLILVAIFTNKIVPQQVTNLRPVAETIVTCRVCGTQVKYGQVYCGNCGRVLEWKKPQ
jgi:hypothetical protein